MHQPRSVTRTAFTRTGARSLAFAALVMGAMASAGCGSSNDGASFGDDSGLADTTDDVGILDDVGTTDDSGAADGSSLDAIDASFDADASLDAADAKLATDAKAEADAKTTYVSLGAAAAFVVLAGETVTNTGFTVVNGNLGISPGAAITGFPPGKVSGVVHLADPESAAGKKALNDAYKDAASRSGAPVPISGDLGGRTLTPGLYVSATSLAIDSGDLTLNAGGDEDAIWVFQIGTTFVSFVGRKVILAGNARADNVFWNVGSSATIGVKSLMVGNFLTETSITVQTGATMEGRFLTQTGAVTFDSNNINKPKPVH